ncbi:MAG: hypothetical protein HY706_10415 [Candidatus Hydrogenedentes bacterium]|nr:hypothetical protein [Candidatus Hydrogenedentota bacterium]
MQRISREEAAAYQARWKALREREEAELRNTPIETKLQQLAVLMFSVDAFGWRPFLEREDRCGHERWAELHKRYRG